MSTVYGPITFAVVKPDASINLVYIEDHDPTLEMLQGAVDGYIEGVTPNYLLNLLPANKQRLLYAYANEEGLMNGFTYNRVASYIAGHPIVGNLVIVMYDEDGESVELPDSVVRTLARMTTVLTVTKPTHTQKGGTE